MSDTLTMKIAFLSFDGASLTFPTLCVEEIKSLLLIPQVYVTDRLHTPRSFHLRKKTEIE